MIKSSPRLMLSSYGYKHLENGEDGFWCCLEWLEKFFDVPTVRSYWLEVNDKQWKDGSGIAVCIRCICDTREHEEFEWSFQYGRRWRDMYSPSSKFLAKAFPDMLNGLPKTIYFRLLYEE